MRAGTEVLYREGASPLCILSLSAVIVSSGDARYRRGRSSARRGRQPSPLARIGVVQVRPRSELSIFDIRTCRDPLAILNRPPELPPHPARAHRSAGAGRGGRSRRETVPAGAWRMSGLGIARITVFSGVARRRAVSGGKTRCEQGARGRRWVEWDAALQRLKEDGQRGRVRGGPSGEGGVCVQQKGSARRTSLRGW